MAAERQMQRARKSNCHLCGYFCGVAVQVDQNERITHILPDPDRYPCDPAVMGRCQRFVANRDLIDHPARMNTPLKRVGKRGSGKWQRVSWAHAMADIAKRLTQQKETYGAESLATCISAPHTIYWPLHRFLNLWGSPNNVGIGIVCWNPRIWVNSLTYGWPIEDELNPAETQCVMIWGMNPAESDRSLFWKTLKDFAGQDRKIVVVDPRRTRTAELADHWLPIRPGTDGALALGMLHVIIHEGIYDHAFVKNWCQGFQQLSERVKAYDPASVSAITGIPVSVIETTARLYASSKPASIFTGLGIDMSGYNCTHALRAIACLRAITGNLDVPGGSFINERPDFIPEVDLELSHMLPASQRAKKLGQGRFTLQRYEGYETLTRFTLKHGKRLPARYLTSAHPHLVWQAMLTGDPYPIRGLICMASNPLLCQSDSQLVHQALKSLDVLVVLEQFMTPTAMLADYIMPIAGSFEQPLMQMNGGVANLAYGGAAALAPRFERQTDFYFWSELGKRCSQESYWPWETLEDAMQEILAPAQITWDDFCETGGYAPEKTYQKYQKQGFATPSGKVELHSTIMQDFGHDPLPMYFKVKNGNQEFPLTLMTGVRKHPYYSSEFRQLQRFRNRHPWPKAEISPATAARLGLREGDSVWIETQQGRIWQALTISDMLDDLVSIEYGWWYPEKEAAEPILGGVFESNANVLTSADTAKCDPAFGQWNLRAVPCKLYKAKEKTDD
ncbi:molybdopterin-containing oxidoreductase family protein [Desulfosarcina cetonica]|uniref:molybdopterin-containing oxidoreductase family protein n=1 Tax=Desulfosarcina cetonica TaxID=90730 RepID=UPI000AB4D1C5|nr:molybdopterin-dependent oxidoreductase [Desulfosarcina cetonica]